ncbi:MAG: FAD-dependent oxidoreductase [Mycoplasmoidaceae bacterium]|nr:FAD-dependent oxidoreductase [Mycoplasmoidaceae bacterium]
MNKLIYDALIIGGGPAGMFAGIYGYQKKLNLILIEQTGFLGGQPLTYPNKPVNDFPLVPNITGKELIEKLSNQLQFNTNVKILFNSKIVSFTFIKNVFEIKLTNNQIITCKNVIIATGNICKEIPGIELNNDNRIIVKQNQLTNLKHIYAIGNVCYYIDKPSSMVTACGEASVAIRSILNSHE